MKARAAAVLLSLAVASAPVRSGVNRWTPVASLPEATGEQATLWSTPTAPGLLWAQSGGGWIWQSRDGGNHFALTKGQLGFFLGLTFDLGDPARAWAFGEGGVFETRDAGRSWQRRIAGAPYDMVWTPILGGSLIGTEYRGMIISHRGRSPWRRLGDCTGSRLRVAPSDGSVFCFGTDALYRVDRSGSVDFALVSLDGAQGWTLQDLVVAPQDSSLLYALLINRDDSTLARSTDRGTTWQALADPSPGGSFESWRTLLAAGPGPDRLVVLVDRQNPETGAWFTTVVETLDGGATWSTPRPAPSGSVFADASDSRILFAWKGLTLWRSDDTGQSWQPAGGIPLTGGLRSPATHLLPDGRVEILGFTYGADSDLHLARSANGGHSWSLDRLHGNLANGARALVPDPLRPLRIYLVSESGIARSEDDGRTWSWILTPFVASYPVVDLVISPRTGKDLYVVTGGNQVVVSHDGGATWKIGGAGLGPVEDPDHGGGNGGLALVLDPDHPRRAWLAYDSTVSLGWDVYHTNDGGLTWRHSHSGIPHGGYPAPVPGLLRTTSGRLLLGTTNGLLTSGDGLDWIRIDGPTTWLQLSDPRTGALYAAIPDPNGLARLAASHDDGETWDSISCGWPGGGGPLLLDPSSPGRLLAPIWGLGLWAARFDRPCP